MKEPTKDKLVSALIRALFRYDPDTGVITFRLPTLRRQVGELATVKCSTGHLVVCVGHQKFYAHQIAWILETGEFPDCPIDHIDLDPANNRFKNLRLATHSQNSANCRVRRHSKTGVKGVTMSSPPSKKRPYTAKIATGDGKRTKYIGRFFTKEEAHAAYLKEAKERFGEFARGS